MGINQNIRKSTINFVPEPLDSTKFSEAVKKKKLFSSNDFSIEEMKKKALLLFGKAMKLDDGKEKYSILEDAVSYDNTNYEILKEYLLNAKKYCDKYENLFNKYIYHIPRDIYKEITGNDKTNEAIKLLSEVFTLLKNYEINNKNYYEQILEKNKILNFFNPKKNEIPLIKVNSTFSIKSNLELSLYEAYLCLFKEFYDCIKGISDRLEKNDSDFDKNLIEFCLPDQREIVKMVIKITKSNKNATILYNSVFFSDTMKNIRNYIISIEKTIEKCLELKHIETDFYLLFFIILEIKYMIVHETEPLFANKIKIYGQIDNNVESNTNLLKNDYGIAIKNSYKYDTNEIINEIKNGASTIFNNVRLFKYIKLEYYNSNNIIRYMFKFIEKFNARISKSRTIIEALYKIYPELKQFKLFESKFTTELFQSALKNCYFFPFLGKIGSTTLNSSGTILFFIPNKTKISEKDLKMESKINFYLVGNLAVFIYIELHEVLGHFLRIILSKIIEFDYISPRYPDTNLKEAGKCIEFLLFGKRVSLFSVQELLFLLDVNNYDKILDEYKEEFSNINLKPLNPSEELKNMLKEINIEFDYDKMDDNDNAASLFRDSYILDDFNIEMPNLQNCVEYFDFSPNENLTNLIQNYNIKKESFNNINL